MMHSLGLKLGLLLAATAAILWIGWDGLYDPAASSRPRSSTTQESASPLDLNRATMEELTTLPGVGKVIAERIIRRRENAGLYTSVQQLLDVHGIGEARLARLRPHVSVSAGGTDPGASSPEGRRGS